MKKQHWNNKSDYNKSNDREKEEVVFRGAHVEVRNNDVNYALRKLKKILERNDWQKDLAKHEHFEKGSVKRKRKKEAAKKRWQKEVTAQKLAGKWAVVRSSDLKFMKSKRKRRKRLDEDAMLDRMRRRNGNSQ
jgi:small subunit ribosomal protein S21